MCYKVYSYTWWCVVCTAHQHHCMCAPDWMPYPEQHTYTHRYMHADLHKHTCIYISTYIDAHTHTQICTASALLSNWLNVFSLIPNKSSHNTHNVFPVQCLQPHHDKNSQHPNQLHLISIITCTDTLSVEIMCNMCACLWICACTHTNTHTRAHTNRLYIYV